MITNKNIGPKSVGRKNQEKEGVAPVKAAPKDQLPKRSSPRREPSRQTMRRAPVRRVEHREIKKPNESALRFCALGGLEEIGRNMMFFEYQNEIIIIDAGIQFPEEETPGIDYIIPNVSYLAEKKKNIKALIITHAHYDHIGAIPYILEKIGNPPIYTMPLAKEMILKRHAEFVNAPKPDIRTIKNWDSIKLSPSFEAEFFGVTHSIPDATGVVLKTPEGNMVVFGDLRVEYDDESEPLDVEEFEKVGSRDINVAFIDSTNAENPGRSLSERVVSKNLEELFMKCDGRIIVGLFATHLLRIAEIIRIAEKIGRKVVFSGRSIKDNTEIAERLGYIKHRKETVIPAEEIHKYKDNQILVLSTGAQGESNASLMKIVSGMHRNIQLKKGDSVIFSSSVIPGNERSVQILKDNLVRTGATVYHSKLLDIHATGHASQEEIRIILKAVKPKHVIPVHGYIFQRSTNVTTASEVGVPRENSLLPDNGDIVEITKDTIVKTGETVPSTYVLVDGLGVGDVGEVVLRDRLLLAQEGMVVIITTINRRDGQLVKNPDIISRGFIYIKENQKVIDDIRGKVRGLISHLPQNQEVDADYLKGLIRDQIGQFIYSKTNRRPMVIPVIIEV